MKKLVTIATIVLTILVVGCSEQNNAPKKVQGDSKKPKTVVVNKGMSKKEEDKLNKRLAELEDKVNDESTNQPEQDTNGTEESVRTAAEDYYAAAASGNYEYTYSKLSSYSQSQITKDEWVADNTTMGSDEAIYSVDAVQMVNDSTGNVFLTITSPDGSSSERATQFVLEDGSWKHDLTQEEYNIFAGATDTSASASDSASASGSGSANANTKHVKIVISSNEPADVSINDDSLDWFVTEEITGTKTYERDIAKNSGLSVSAVTDAASAETTIQVFENGSLVAQDSDSSGLAMVNY
jgi:hypothetical protein